MSNPLSGISSSVGSLTGSQGAEGAEGAEGGAEAAAGGGGGNVAGATSSSINSTSNQEQLLGAAEKSTETSMKGAADANKTAQEQTRPQSAGEVAGDADAEARSQGLG